MVRAFTESFHLSRQSPYDSRGAAVPVPYQARTASDKGTQTLCHLADDTFPRRCTALHLIKNRVTSYIDRLNTRKWRYKESFAPYRQVENKKKSLAISSFSPLLLRREPYRHLPLTPTPTNQSANVPALPLIRLVLWLLLNLTAT